MNPNSYIGKMNRGNDDEIQKEMALDVIKKTPEEEIPFLQSDNIQKDEDVTFEDVLRKLGSVGKYQYIHGALCLTSGLFIAFSALKFVFVGYTPSHVCNKINETEFLSNYGLLNDSSIKFSYEKCDITVYSNQTGQMKEVVSVSCPNGRHFPGGKHKTLVSEWDLVCEKTGQAEIAPMLYTVGNVLGGLFVPYIADRFGRKPLLCISCILTMILEFSMVFSPNIYYMFIAYFLEGMVYAGGGCTFVLIVVEILIPQHRAIFGVIDCLSWVGGLLCVALAAYLLQDVSWRYFQATSALTGLFSLLMPFFLYESPRWLAIHGKSKEALKILRKASEQNGKEFAQVKETFENYMECLLSTRQEHRHIRTDEKYSCKMTNNTRADWKGRQESNQHQYTIIRMFKRKETCILLLIVWYLWTTCNVTYYGIFMSSSDLAGNRFLNFALLAVVEIPANFLMLYMMKRMGRLQVLRSFVGLAAVGLLGSLLLDNLGNDSSKFDITSLVLFVFGKFAITGLFNAVYIITPELFPTVLRSSGIGSCKSVPRIGSMLAPYTRPLYTLAKWAPGLIFSSMCFLALFLTFFLPETKDKILPTKLTDVNSNKINETEEEI